MENTLFSIEKGRAMEGAMEDWHMEDNLWRKKSSIEILQKTPSMEINKRPESADCGENSISSK